MSFSKEKPSKLGRIKFANVFACHSYAIASSTASTSSLMLSAGVRQS